MGILAGTVDLITTGLLVAILFGALGKIVHLLELIECHLKAARNRPGWSKAQIVLSTDDLIGHGLAGLKGSGDQTSDRRPN